MIVILGNPPYNVGQLNENDNNKNRKYDLVDERLRNTYVKDSKATNKNMVYDAYVKFFRWATDRLNGKDGVVCFVSNNSFVDQIPFDGMRKHLIEDFTRIYHVNLGGNVRQNPKLSGTKHNVFGIQVGVGITVAIRSSKHQDRKIFYRHTPEFWTKVEKLAWLTQNVEMDGRYNSLNTVDWIEINQDKKYNWLQLEHSTEFESFLHIGSKETKSGKLTDTKAIFKAYSPGLQTNRDDWVYGFNLLDISAQMVSMIEVYNSEIDRWRRAGKPKDIDNFVLNDDKKIKWSSSLKETFVREIYGNFVETKLRTAMYRPFSRMMVFFDNILNHRQGLFRSIFPTLDSEQENVVICCTNHSQVPFSAIIAKQIPDVAVGGRPGQCFPFYTYDEDGTNRRENITDWALDQFRAQYGEASISKWDIFYYVYGLLHHPQYRERYADNLKRELPRIPFAPEFRPFCAAGRRLAELHLGYEGVEEYPLDWVENPKVAVNWRVEKMKLIKNEELRSKKEMQKAEGTRQNENAGEQQAAVVVNDWLTLKGIPAAAFEYKLGNRSALEWVIDQYQVKHDARSGITSDPNNADDPEYIARLIGRVVRVSVETVAIVGTLPELGIKN